MANGQAQLFFLLCLLTTGKRIIPPPLPQLAPGRYREQHSILLSV